MSTYDMCMGNPNSNDWRETQTRAVVGSSPGIWFRCQRSRGRGANKFRNDATLDPVPEVLKGKISQDEWAEFVSEFRETDSSVGPGAATECMMVVPIVGTHFLMSSLHTARWVPRIRSGMDRLAEKFQARWQPLGVEVGRTDKRLGYNSFVHCIYFETCANPVKPAAPVAALHPAPQEKAGHPLHYVASAPVQHPQAANPHPQNPMGWTPEAKPRVWVSMNHV
mmetsp:Transcript_31031/g.48623  ORF Transcript_31031/g.48623 Transcript_31031/m.48623 type:complete len:223 (-) Transcript_31031:93-761(-)